MGWRRIVVIAAIVLAIGAGFWWAFTPQPLAVDLAVAERGTLTVTIDDEGVVRIRDTYQISMPIGGDVQRIPLQAGDHVDAGTVVASIVPQLSGFLDERSRAEAVAAVRTAEASVMSAQNEVSGAESELAYWQSEWDRTQRLVDRGLTTLQSAEQTRLQLDRAEVAIASAKGLLELRQRQLEQAEARLIEPDSEAPPDRRFDLEAPASGQVLEVANESARSLPSGAPLLTIGDPNNLEVVVDLLSEDAVRIKAAGGGAPAWIDAWGGDTELVAQVRQIEPMGFTRVSALGVEEQRVRVHLDILSDPEQWRDLGHLYRVFVRIQAERVDDAVLAPTAALFRSGDDWALYTVADGTASLRLVEIGARDARFAEIVSGLEQGEAVILHPTDTIEDGKLVVDRAQLAE